jgi:hypothetical protein
MPVSGYLLPRLLVSHLQSLQVPRVDELSISFSIPQAIPCLRAEWEPLTNPGTFMTNPNVKFLALQGVSS